MGDFEDLVVWQRAVDLSASIYVETKTLRDFGFRDQITRAGLSIPSNIAEGLERATFRDQIKFLDYARGSCGEVRTQAIVGIKADLLASPQATHWRDEAKEITAMINGLIRAIRSRG